MCVCVYNVGEEKVCLFACSGDIWLRNQDFRTFSYVYLTTKLDYFGVKRRYRKRETIISVGEWAIPS